MPPEFCSEDNGQRCNEEPLRELVNALESLSNIFYLIENTRELKVEVKHYVELASRPMTVLKEFVQARQRAEARETRGDSGDRRPGSGEDDDAGQSAA